MFELICAYFTSINDMIMCKHEYDMLFKDLVSFETQEHFQTCVDQSTLACYNAFGDIMVKAMEKGLLKDNKMDDETTFGQSGHYARLGGWDIC